MAINKKKLRKKIRNLFKAECNLSEAERHSKYVEDAIKLGIETDADGIALVLYEHNQLSAALHVGSSVLFGSDIWLYLLNYQNGSQEGANHCIDWITEQALDAFAKGECYSANPLIDGETNRWRAFRVSDGKLLTSKEIKNQSIAAMN